MSHQKVKILAQHGITRVRKGMGYASSVIQDNIFFFNNSMSVMYRALMERLYYVKSKNRGGEEFVLCPQPTHSFDDLNYFKSAIKHHLPCLPPVWSTEQFVDSYSGPKHKRYAAAAVILGRTGPRRSYGYPKTFIKGEFYNGTAKQNPCPRLIQPRDAVYNILIGRYVRPMEKCIYKSIDRIFGHHVVLKCDTPWQRANAIHSYWSEFSDPCFVGFDASRFDQHTSAAALEWEHSVYLNIHNDPEFREYLSWQVNNVGYANTPDGTIMYETKGCRMSGDMNTALGNVIIMCGLCHKYLKSLGIKFRFIDDGDDCGVFLERADLHTLQQLPEHHLQYGYEMTVEKPVYELEQVEFCQSRPVNCGDGNWMMVRNVHKALAHDALMIDKHDWVEVQNVLAATGICGLALYNNMPVLGEFYGMLSRCGTDKKQVDHMLNIHKTGPQTWRFHANPRGFDVDETVARVSIYRAFGILPDVQIALENEYRAQRLSNTPIHSRQSNFAEDNISYYLQ